MSSDSASGDNRREHGHAPSDPPRHHGATPLGARRRPDQAAQHVAPIEGDAGQGVVDADDDVRPGQGTCQDGRRTARIEDLRGRVADTRERERGDRTRSCDRGLGQRGLAAALEVGDATEQLQHDPMDGEAEGPRHERVRELVDQRGQAQQDREDEGQDPRAPRAVDRERWGSTGRPAARPPGCRSGGISHAGSPADTGRCRRRWSPPPRPSSAAGAARTPARRGADSARSRRSPSARGPACLFARRPRRRVARAAALPARRCACVDPDVGWRHA